MITARTPAFTLKQSPALIGSSEAIFSPDEVYRYTLTRTWGTSGTHAIWIMLNPSTADHETEDATVRRVISFTKSWNLDGLTVLNLFALRSTDPQRLLSHPAPVGPDNDYFIREKVHPWSVVVAAWGAHTVTAARGRQVLQMIAPKVTGVGCLGTTKGGFPKHPLYVPASQELEDFPAAGAQ